MSPTICAPLCVAEGWLFPELGRSWAQRACPQQQWAVLHWPEHRTEGFLCFFCFCSTCTQPKDKPWARSSKAMRFSLFYMQSPSDPVEGTGLRLALSRSVKNITSCMMPFAVLMGEGRKKNAEVLQMCYKEAEKKYGSHTFILSCCLLIEPYLWIDAGELQNQFMSTTFVGCQEKHSVLLD